MSAWPNTDQQLALAEGWDIFYCTGADGHEPYELCVLDDPASLPELGLDEPVFADDPAAWEHVVTRAAEGSDLHNRALLFLASEAPGELVHIAFWRAGIKPCPCVSCSTVFGRWS